MSLIGLLGDLVIRSDLSELSMCKGNEARCTYPVGHHDEQARLQAEFQSSGLTAEEWSARRGEQ